jgi:nucleoside-diphosphate-sugar epimerase
MGDLLDRQSLRQALGEAKVVIHCGLGQAGGIVRGTQNLLEVTADARAERFIHMSTAAVYGERPSPGCEIEQAPLRRTGDSYCDNKVRAERVVRRFARRGLPAVILRPSIVYGPYSFWSTRLLKALRERHIALIDGGKGACNTTYVDNLVDAVFLAVENLRAVGESFFITDGEQITWGDFIRSHIAMMNPQPTVPSISSEEVITHYRQQRGIWASSFREARRVLLSVEFRKMLVQIPACERVLSAIWSRFQVLDQEKQLRFKAKLRGTYSTIGWLPLNENGKYIPDLTTWATESHAVFFRIDKARQVLGYAPRIPFVRGITLVEQWLRFANYL